MKYWGLFGVLFFVNTFAYKGSVFIIEKRTNFEEKTPYIYQITDFDQGTSTDVSSTSIPMLAQFEYHLTKKQYSIQLTKGYYLNFTNPVDNSIQNSFLLNNWRFKNTNSNQSNNNTFTKFGPHLMSEILVDVTPVNGTQPTGLLQTKEFFFYVINHDADDSIASANITTVTQTFANGKLETKSDTSRFISPVYKYCFDQRPKFQFGIREKDAVRSVYAEYENTFKKLNLNMHFVETNDIKDCHVIISNGDMSPTAPNGEFMRGETTKNFIRNSYKVSLVQTAQIKLFTRDPSLANYGQYYSINDLVITLRHEILHSLGFEHTVAAKSIMAPSHNFFGPETENDNPSNLQIFDLNQLSLAFKDFSN